MANPYHIINRPYWYDDSASPMVPVFDDLDLPPLSITKLRGNFPAPGDDLYYWGLDRMEDLNSTTYKPNNPYAYGQCFMLAEYGTVLSSPSLFEEGFSYDDLWEGFFTIHERHPDVSTDNITYVPISVKIGQSAALSRNYYLEFHVTGTRGYSSDTGYYLTLSENIYMRIEETDTHANSLVFIQGSSGGRIYQSYTYSWQLLPTFASWYNNDAAEPSVVYVLGAVRKYSSSTWTMLPMQTGAEITNNGHTFRQLLPNIPNIDDFTLIYWESSAYEFMNPGNAVPFNDLVEDMGPYGPESDQDGYPLEPEDGHGDDSSDTIEIPPEPEIGVTNVGFVNVYKTGLNSLQNMGVELFPDLQYTNPTPISGSATVIDSIEAGFNSIITALANIPSIVAQQVAATLVNYIIDCHVIPVTPTTGNTENIKVGYKTLTAEGDRLSSDYVTFPCGSIRLGEYYSSFADFLDSTKLFLPFIGFVPARPEWYYADTLTVTYRFNVIDGSFMAYVQATGKYVNNNGEGGTCIAQYGGNACIHLPITGVTYSNMVAGLVGAGAGAVAGAASGNIAAVATGALSAASAKGDIPQSNAYSASAAFMSIRRPFLLIERTVTNYSPSFRKENGIPSNVTKTLGNVTGFNMVGNIHLDGIDATDSEKAEIERLLREGVIL